MVSNPFKTLRIVHRSHFLPAGCCRRDRQFRSLGRRPAEAGPGLGFQTAGANSTIFDGSARVVAGGCAGVVIGNYGDSVQHAVLYDAHRGTWTPLPDVPGLPVNLGDGINSRGVATGVACEGDFLAVFTACYGWTWDGDDYSLFSAPGAGLANGGTSGQGINDGNQVAGFFTDANGVNHGFVKDGDEFTNVDVPGATNTYAFDINDRGETVGFYTDAVGINHGFLERHGKFTTVDVPGALVTQVLGNDARGDLAGLFVDSNGVHGFVAFKE